MKRKTAGLAVVVAFGLSACGLGTDSASAPFKAGSGSATAMRAADPVILTGDDVASLRGIAPRQVVAFRWAQGAWQQIPVQVDERALIDLRSAYPADFTCEGTQTPEGSGCYEPPTGRYYEVRYTDPQTWIGPDPDPTLDGDDEIAFMARDAGAQAPAGTGTPGGTVGGSGLALRITDPLSGAVGYAYLFRSDGGLDPAAGKKYVNYQFRLLRGEYKSTFDHKGNPEGNPEDSWVDTPHYKRGFTDRLSDWELRVKTGTASGVDILDRHEIFAADHNASGNCIRDTYTYNTGEGAWIASVSGPIRAIRNYLGTNSAPLGERMQIFYDGMEYGLWVRRVHPFYWSWDLFDYSADAIGMKYRNSPNEVNTAYAPIVIDGANDANLPGAYVLGQTTWEDVNGPQGGIAMVHQFVESQYPDPTYDFVYVDDAAAANGTCGGDDTALLGASGPRFGNASSTDGEPPTAHPSSWTRTIYFKAPFEADGPAAAALVDNPLQVSVEFF
jgi:hypothetical protein